jgi:hypothetical protein
MVFLAQSSPGCRSTRPLQIKKATVMLGFHAAWDFGPKGRTITNREATQKLYSMYPSPIRRWIAQRGGLTSHMIYLRGKQLARMYKPCYLDAHHYFAVGG